MDGQQLLIARGHQDDVGESIVCAGISAVMWALAIAAREEESNANLWTGDGEIRILAPRGERLDAMFDMAVTGLEAMRDKYQGRIAIDKKVRTRV